MVSSERESTQCSCTALNGPPNHPAAPDSRLRRPPVSGRTVGRIKTRPRQRMSLKFPSAWRFKPPADGQFANRSVPMDAVEECISLIMKVATQGEQQEVLEHFKAAFAGAAGASYSWSSSASWADTDLRRYANEAAENAPLFIEAFYDACESFGEEDSDAWALDVSMINEILQNYGLGYVIDPP